MPKLHAHYDVVVAGARCAGASTALLLARGGARVLVVDPLPRGRDTLSTHALMRGAVLQLHRWGLLDALRRAGTPEIRVTTFDYEDGVVSVPIQSRDGVDALFAPRRTVLDPILCAGAEEAGAQVEHGVSAQALLRDASGRIRGVQVAGADGAVQAVSADLVVGADGARSKVARWVSAEVERRGAHATASIYGYWRGIPRDDNRWTFRPGMGMGTIPTNDGATCVFVSVARDAFVRTRAVGLDPVFHDLVGRTDPELAGLLDPTRREGPLRGFAGAEGFLRVPAGPGWALVGDAGYFRDPLTAHGISDALRDAELLARAYLGGGWEEYHARRNEAAQGVMEVTDRIASMAWSTEEVKALHHRLSREMNVGVETVRALDAVSSPAA